MQTRFIYPILLCTAILNSGCTADAVLVQSEPRYSTYNPGYTNYTAEYPGEYGNYYTEYGPTMWGEPYYTYSSFGGFGGYGQTRSTHPNQHR